MPVHLSCQQIWAGHFPKGKTMEAVFTAGTPISPQANTAIQLLPHPTWIQLAEMVLSCYVRHAASKSLWLFLEEGTPGSKVLCFSDFYKKNCTLPASQQSVGFTISLIPVSHMNISQLLQDPAFAPCGIALHSIPPSSQSVKQVRAQEVNSCSNFSHTGRTEGWQVVITTQLGF